MSREKLLVLDDEPRILSSIEDLFEDDYQVLTTTDPHTALQLAQQNDVAVILTDERMPGLSGHQFLQQVKEVSPATRIMISGYADLKALTQAVNDGQIYAYVAKPWEARELKQMVRSAVGHFQLVQAIGREHERLRVLMESIPDLIFFKDVQSRFTHVNREHALALGARTPEDCLGKTDADFLEAAYARRSHQDERQIVQSGRPLLDQIEKLGRADGRLCWMSTTKVPIFDRDGVVSGLAGISRDITSLKNIEETLREKSELNRLIIETANDAFIAMDANESITAWNRQAELTLGWTASEVMGRVLTETIVAAARRPDQARFFVRPAERLGASKRMELTVVHRDGHEFPVEVTLWPIRQSGSVSFNAFLRDISERRRAEEVIHREAALLQLVQAVTVAANESSTIEHAAQICLDRICSHTGWPVGKLYLPARDPSGELISTGVWQAAARDRFAAFERASGGMRYARGEGLPGRVLISAEPEWIVVREADNFPRAEAARQAGLRSGLGFPILVQSEVMGVLEFFSFEAAQPDGEFLKLMAHIGSQLGQVIVRQRAQEDLGRAKVAAESANRAKSQFLATMSHEIRTPMNAILGMAELLSETPLSPEQKEYVAIFQRGGARLLDLINDILDLSRVESGRFELSSVHFDLHSVLEATLEIMRPRAQAKGLRLTCEVRPEVPLGLTGDPARLWQVLVNLMGNAMKFTERGTVELRVERDAAGSGAGALRFIVADTGIGIAPEQLQMIFGTFTQADSSTTRKYGGTGLGLAISKGLVELMGGKIGVSSQVGTGSTFYFTARFGLSGGKGSPASGNDAPFSEAWEPLAGAAEPGPGIRILLAEDSQDNVFLVQAYLKNSGFELEVAGNGREAVEKFQSGTYHLVLMDMQMPAMDGQAATRAIREWERLQRLPGIPIVALTAHAFKEEVEACAAAGCVGHLAKPISKKTLLEAIARYALPAEARSEFLKIP